jgi:hypothetical protein
MPDGKRVKERDNVEEGGSMEADATNGHLILFLVSVYKPHVSYT